MHMTCQPPCRNEFCWLCLGPWKDHGERTGGFYACNRYESARAGGEYEDSERRRESAKNSLERYMHYYERWVRGRGYPGAFCGCTCGERARCIGPKAPSARALL